MPKEITHWTLAEQTLSQLEDECSLKKILTKNKPYYYLGAVIIDSPFYCLYGKNSKLINQVGQTIHNNKTNSFLPIFTLLDPPHRRIPDQILAVICGIISHIYADSSFHPLINYFSGDKRTSGKKRNVQYRHHELETHIDLFYLNQVVLINQGRFHMTARQTETKKDHMIKMISKLYFGTPEHHSHLIKKTLKQHSKIQNLFWQKWFLWLLRLINLCPGINLKPEIALFYPQKKPLDTPFFHKKLSYKHPVTGDQLNESITEIGDRCISKTLYLFKQIEKDRYGQAINKHFLANPGPNLNTGLVNVPAEEMSFFDSSLDTKALIHPPLAPEHHP